MRAVPIVGAQNLEPSDATRPAGEWRLYYCPYRGCMAPLDGDVLVWREGWDEPIRQSQLHPTSNVVGLLWQPQN